MACVFTEMWTKAKVSKQSAGNIFVSATATAPLTSVVSDHSRHDRKRSRLFGKSASIGKHPSHASKTPRSTSPVGSVQTSEASGTEDAFAEVFAGVLADACTGFQDMEEMASDEFAFVQISLEDSTVVHSTLEPAGTSSWTSCETALAHMDGSQNDRRSVQSSPVLPVVRNTFIHIPDDTTREVVFFWPTAPSVMLSKDFRTKYPAMEQAHVKGDCRPCAYFINKGDGCRRGENCAFCHLCPPGALKKKKRQKVKALKERDWMEKHGFVAE